MSRESLLHGSKHFCMAPWTHLCAESSGNVMPCCYASRDQELGNLHSSTLAEIWNSDATRKLRLNMLEDRPTELCWRCYELESVGSYSHRLRLNRTYAHHFPLVESTTDDGTVARLNMPYMDLRFSNLCNFSCRTCGPDSSTTWYEDAQRLWGPFERVKLRRAIDDPVDLWRQLEPLLDHVEEIYFSGGEPLIMEEHYKVLGYLADHKRYGVRLLYNTNFSTMRYQSMDVLELWSRFESVTVGASLDGTRARGEYLRKGQVWSQVLENRKRMREVCPNARFHVSFTLSVMNSLHAPDMHRECVAEGLIEPNHMVINIVNSEKHFRVQILPAPLKERMRELYRGHIKNFIEPFGPSCDDVRGHFAAALKFLDNGDVSDHLPVFRDFTRRLDEIRGESFVTVFPELSALMDAA
jgi:radical SAM protein with 4Fe4S-binding SPASM domain